MSEPGGDPSSGISSGDALILPERHPACRRREARPGFRMERENLCFVTSEDVKGQAASGSNREGESTEAGRRGGAARSSVEGPVMGLERRGCVVRPWPLANWKQEEPVDEAKPFKQRSNIGSRVTREGHARFWERPEVIFLRATRQTEKDLHRHQHCRSTSNNGNACERLAPPASAQSRQSTTVHRLAHNPCRLCVVAGIGYPILCIS